MSVRRFFLDLVKLAVIVLVFMLVVVACGGDDTADDATTSTDTSTSVDTTSPDTTAAPTTTGPTTTTEPATTTTAGPIAIDPAWVAYEDEFVVWGVALDDTLNVRTGPGVGNPVITTLAPTARSVQRFDVTEWVGDSPWGVIRLTDGAGWVNLAYLRPAGSNPPRIEGTIVPRTETAADDVQALLGAGEYEGVAGFVDPARGLVISVDAFIDDSDQILDPDEVVGAATDTTDRLWGYTDGEGLPIESTIAERFAAIAGDPGITSTDVIAFDVRVGVGNTIDNIAERFPGSSVVEYHFAGTSLYGDFDWHSVRFVFDTEDSAPTGRPALLAIVQDTWTI